MGKDYIRLSMFLNGGLSSRSETETFSSFGRIAGYKKYHRALFIVKLIIWSEILTVVLVSVGMRELGRWTSKGPYLYKNTILG